MTRAALRRWAVRLTWASIAGHLAVGVLLPLIVDAPLLDGYHHGIETAFWGAAGAAIAPAARAQQNWWIALFGPTIQAAAVWMAALCWMGDRQRNAFAWGALIAGLLLWAPQDMLISLRADCWSHVWLDCGALALMLPPLACLVMIDRARAAERPA